MSISSKPLLAKRKFSDEASCGLGTKIELDALVIQLLQEFGIHEKNLDSKKGEN